MPAPTLRKLAGVFLRVGNTTFGGGLPTITAITNGASNIVGAISPGEIVVVLGGCSFEAPFIEQPATEGLASSK